MFLTILIKFDAGQTAQKVPHNGSETQKCFVLDWLKEGNISVEPCLVSWLLIEIYQMIFSLFMLWNTYNDNDSELCYWYVGDLSSNILISESVDWSLNDVLSNISYCM